MEITKSLLEDTLERVISGLEDIGSGKRGELCPQAERIERELKCLDARVREHGGALREDCRHRCSYYSHFPDCYENDNQTIDDWMDEWALHYSYTTDSPLDSPTDNLAIWQFSSWASDSTMVIKPCADLGPGQWLAEISAEGLSASRNFESKNLRAWCEEVVKYHVERWTEFVRSGNIVKMKCPVCGKEWEKKTESPSHKEYWTENSSCACSTACAKKKWEQSIG